MGGQACVFYGAAEFSRDLDLLILADDDNLARLARALEELAAQPIAVPPFDPIHLLRGHAVHFRCGRDDVQGLRIDIMAHLRGVADFDSLWRRRTTIEAEGEPVDLLGIEDLVRAKKTQRDKDWPMIRRLIEQSYFRRPPAPTSTAIEFWLCELRTPELLLEVAATFPEPAKRVAGSRPAVEAALAGSLEQVAELLDAEEREERRKDQLYWAPLKRELEQLRLARGKPPG
jgi:hypothetical protein